MPSLYTHQSANLRKTWLLITAFFVLIMLIGWIFSYVFNSAGIFYIAVLFSIVTSFVSYWFSDKMVIAMTRAKPVTREENPELHRLVENLCITTGLPKPRIYMVNDPQPNAFATGRDPAHAVVAITTGLDDMLDRTELEGVLAHELAHIGNRDMLVSTVAVVLAGAIAMASDMLMRATLFGGMGRRNDRGGGGALIVVIGIIAAVLAPLAAMLMQMAISRKREFLADATGALTTRYPEGLAKALEKIGAYKHSMHTATHATAHLFIANPFRGREAVSWLTKLFMTHPLVEDRVSALRGMELES